MGTQETLEKLGFKPSFSRGENFQWFGTEGSEPLFLEIKLPFQANCRDGSKAPGHLLVGERRVALLLRGQDWHFNANLAEEAEGDAFSINLCS